MTTAVLDQRNGRMTGPLFARLVIFTLQALALAFSLFGFRGYSRVCRAIVSFFTPTLEIVVKINAYTQFSFPASDIYWIRLITTRFGYEQDIERVLKLIADRPFAFIDCGANFGYWSALASSTTFGAHRTVAVEASSSTIARLHANCALNENRFACEHRAISDVADELVFLNGKRHEERSILGATSGEAVLTTTIDAIAERHDLTGPIVIKLDVEGVEVAALCGATTVMARDALLLYEDHGNDPSCAPSRFLLEQGWKLYDISGHRPRHLPNISAVVRLKQDVRYGYNFAAERGLTWLHAHATS